VISELQLSQLRTAVAMRKASSMEWVLTNALAFGLVQASATTPGVRDEARWLVVVYEHVSEHFDTALRDWYDASSDTDPALSESGDLASIADPAVRQRTFARDAQQNHARLLVFVHSAMFGQLVNKRELLREIRLDVETSQAVQVNAFNNAVEEAGP
jgi:hypothetical protein